MAKQITVSKPYPYGFTAVVDTEQMLLKTRLRNPGDHSLGKGWLEEPFQQILLRTKRGHKDPFQKISIEDFEQFFESAGGEVDVWSEGRLIIDLSLEDRLALPGRLSGLPESMQQYCIDSYQVGQRISGIGVVTDVDAENGVVSFETSFGRHFMPFQMKEEDLLKARVGERCGPRATVLDVLNDGEQILVEFDDGMHALLYYEWGSVRGDEIGGSSQIAVGYLYKLRKEKEK